MLLVTVGGYIVKVTANPVLVQDYTANQLLIVNRVSANQEVCTAKVPHTVTNTVNHNIANHNPVIANQVRVTPTPKVPANHIPHPLVVIYLHIIHHKLLTPVQIHL